MEVKRTPEIEFSHGKMHDDGTKLKEGDLESVHRARRNDGKPIKSDIVRDGENLLFCTIKENRVKIDEVI